MAAWKTHSTNSICTFPLSVGHAKEATECIKKTDYVQLAIWRGTEKNRRKSYPQNLLDRNRKQFYSVNVRNETARQKGLRGYGFYTLDAHMTDFRRYGRVWMVSTLQFTSREVFNTNNCVALDRSLRSVTAVRPSQAKYWKPLEKSRGFLFLGLVTQGMGTPATHDKHGLCHESRMQRPIRTFDN